MQDLLEKISAVAARAEALEQQLADPAVAANPTEYGRVAKELAAYAPLVSLGSYVIVQDTGIGEKWPLAAIRDFMIGNSEFEIDRSRERLILTNSRSGYLKRVKPAASR